MTCWRKWSTTVSTLRIAVNGSDRRSSGCSSTGTEWAEPEPDELMEESGWLEQAGGNVTIDWGPGAKSLLTEYSTLKEELIALKQTLSSMEAEREGLEASLEETRNELKEERNQRAQSDVSLIYPILSFNSKKINIKTFIYQCSLRKGLILLEKGR